MGRTRCKYDYCNPAPRGSRLQRELGRRAGKRIPIRAAFTVEGRGSTRPRGVPPILRYG
jgi:hypothetical protein